MRAGGLLRVVIAGGMAAGLAYGADRAAATDQTGWVRWDRSSDSTSAAAQTGDPAVGTERSDVVCPGPDRADQAPAQQVSLLAAAAPAGVLPAAAHTTGGAATARSLSGAQGERRLEVARPGTDAANVTAAGAGAQLIETTGGRVAGGSAAQWSADDVRSVRGLSFLQCTAPTQDGWLVVGGREPGRVTRLVLANPGDAAVTVATTVLTSAGRDRSSIAGTVVGPGRTVVLTLPTPTGSGPVIHVTSAGGPVSASATDVWLEGESRIGAETTGTTTAPATTADIPALQVGRGQAGVRVAVPGAEDAVVRVRLTGADGTIVAEEVATVPAGRTGELPLTGVAPGQYALHVMSDTPVVAAASARSTGSGDGDLTWAVGAPVVRTVTGTALIPRFAGTATLGLLTTGRTAQVLVTTVDADGRVSRLPVTLRQGTPVYRRGSGAQSVWVTVRSGTVRAAVTVTRSAPGAPLAATSALSAVPVSSTTTPIRPAGDPDGSAD